MTHTLYTFVIAMTPIFSPYVVLGVAPNRPDSTLEQPSANRERSSPGSFIKSRPTIFPVTIRWPMCSVKTTKAAGAIMAMASILKVGAENWGTANQGALMTGVMSTIPRMKANT